MKMMHPFEVKKMQVSQLHNILFHHQIVVIIWNLVYLVNDMPMVIWVNETTVGDFIYKGQSFSIEWTFSSLILVPQINSDFEEWLNDMRDKRAGRPLYGMLG